MNLVIIKGLTPLPRLNPVKVGRILHPSPSSPAANRGWAAAATRQLQALGVWPI
jgi:single-strand selective monofunctional uracil DNA glycosylase